VPSVTTICAGIDTGKRKLRRGARWQLLQLQVENTARRSQGAAGMAAASQGQTHRDRSERLAMNSGRRRTATQTVCRGGVSAGHKCVPMQVPLAARQNDKIMAALIAACTAAVKKIHPAPDPRLQPFAEHLTMIGADRRGY